MVQASQLTSPSDSQFAQQAYTLEFKLWPRRISYGLVWVTEALIAALYPYGSGMLIAYSKKSLPRERINHTFTTHPTAVLTDPRSQLSMLEKS